MFGSQLSVTGGMPNALLAAGTLGLDRRSVSQKSLITQWTVAHVFGVSAPAEATRKMFSYLKTRGSFLT
jgi:hypothetical protein